MGRKDAKTGRVAVNSGTPSGGGVSLAGALRRAGLVPAETSEASAPPVPREAGERAGKRAAGANPDRTEDPGPTDLSSCAKAVLRRERKGHGGHPVTRIEGLGLPAGALQAIAREAARAMGCAARIEGEAVVVAGEPGDRLQDWLLARGVRKVARGN